MYILLVVVNHFGWAGDAASVDYSTFYPFNISAEFHPYCPINPEDYTSNQTRVENVSAHFKTHLKDFLLMQNTVLVGR